MSPWSQSKTLSCRVGGRVRRWGLEEDQVQTSWLPGFTYKSIFVSFYPIFYSQLPQNDISPEKCIQILMWSESTCSRNRHSLNCWKPGVNFNWRRLQKLAFNLPLYHPCSLMFGFDVDNTLLFHCLWMWSFKIKAQAEIQVFRLKAKYRDDTS